MRTSSFRIAQGGLLSIALCLVVVAGTAFGNEAPGAPTIEIAPNPATTVDVLHCVIIDEAVDPENDELVYLYEWFINGVQVGSEDHLDHLLAMRGDVVDLSVRASDGVNPPGPAGTDRVIIANAPPILTQIEISPANPSDTDDLVCVITTPAFDPDGDPVSLRYEWFVNGSLSGETDDVIDASETSLNDTWECVVTPSDGISDGTSASAMVQIGDGGTFVPCDADYNGDGVVNLADISFFAADYYSGLPPSRSDFNGDGSLNLIDVQLLATAVGTTGCL